MMPINPIAILIGAALALFARSVLAAISPQQIESALSKVDDDVVAWRRDIHQHL